MRPLSLSSQSNMSAMNMRHLETDEPVRGSHDLTEQIESIAFEISNRFEVNEFPIISKGIREILLNITQERLQNAEYTMQALQKVVDSL